MVASAIDSPSCGIMIGTCDIKLFPEKRSRFGGDHFRARTMRAPKIRMIWNRSVFCIDAYRRGVEQMKSFTGHTRDHFRRRAAPRERFANAKQTTGPGD